MASKLPRAGRPPAALHKTHVERSAATRRKLIEAAIFCLRNYGYSATTTTLVAEVAGLSRGAMLHQFGTKVELILAVARHVVDEQNKFFEAALREYPRGRERFVGLTDATWEALIQPGAIALLEIMMASRSDAELAEQFPDLAAHFSALQSEGAWLIAKNAGITDRAAVDAMSTLHRAAMQGLSVLLMFTPDPKSLDPALNLLRWYKSQLAEVLIANAENPDAVGPIKAGAKARAKRKTSTAPKQAKPTKR